MSANKLNVLDFTKLDPHNIKLVNNIAEELRQNYINYLSEIGKKYENNIDWWVLNFVSRNTLISPLFCNICYLMMLDKKYKEGNDYNQVIINSPALKKVIERNYSKHCLRVTYKGRNTFLIYMRRIYAYFKIIMHFFLRWIFGLNTCIYQKKNTTE